MIYNHHIVDVVNRLLQKTVFHQCSLSKVTRSLYGVKVWLSYIKVLILKSTAVKILEMMCEETSPRTKDLVKNVFKAVDIDALHTTLAYFHRLSQDEDMVSQAYGDCIYTLCGYL